MCHLYSLHGKRKPALGFHSRITQAKCLHRYQQLFVCLLEPWSKWIPWAFCTYAIYIYLKGLQWCRYNLAFPHSHTVPDHTAHHNILLYSKSNLSRGFLWMFYLHCPFPPLLFCKKKKQQKTTRHLNLSVHFSIKLTQTYKQFSQNCWLLFICLSSFQASPSLCGNRALLKSEG